MFPDFEHIRDMQRELDSIIQIGVYNITQLIKASESPVTSGMQDVEDDFAMKSLSERKRRGKSVHFHDEPVENKRTSDSAYDSRLNKTFHNIELGQGRLTDQLVKQGLLTKEMLAKLQQEWSESADGSDGSGSDGTSGQK